MVNYILSLGTCGPTDCGLVLTRLSGMEDESSKSVEFGIESLGWKILGHYWSIHSQSGDVPNWLGDILIEGDDY